MLSDRLQQRVQFVAQRKAESRSLMHDLELTILQATYRAEESCHLPRFKGSTIRGAFGHSLKELACLRKNGLCGPQCSSPGQCGYSGVFEAVSHAHRNDVVPYIIKPPLETKETWRAGEIISVTMTLAGRAKAWTPWVVWALGRMGWKGMGNGRGKWSLVELDAVGRDGQPVSLLDSFEFIPSVTAANIAERSPKFDACELEFLTPLQLKKRGDVVRWPHPDLVIRRLIGRMGDLLEATSDVQVNRFEIRELTDLASRTMMEHSEFRDEEWERYSTRQQRRSTVSGIQGTLRISGIAPEIAAILNVGQHIHLGNSAAFGMGCYRVRPQPNEK